jgi:hypothetical protein
MRLRRRWQRWLTAQREAYTEFRLRRRREARERREEEARQLMELNALEHAQTKALLQQLDHHTVEAIKVVLREEELPTLREESLTLARAELAEELAKAKERLEDRYARMVEEFSDEIERRIEQGVTRGTRDLKDELEETITDLKAQRQEARTRAQQAEGVLVRLITQLLPSGKQTYLYSSGIRDLSLVDLNTVLGRSGLVVKSRETFSERQVKCQVAPQRWAQRSVFWVDKATAPGVVDEDDEQLPEHQGVDFHGTADRLALPEGERPA